MDKTKIARTSVWPSLVAGILILIAGFGWLFPNKSRIAHFTKAVDQDISALVP